MSSGIANLAGGLDTIGEAEEEEEGDDDDRTAFSPLIRLCPSEDSVMHEGIPILVKRPGERILFDVVLRRRRQRHYPRMGKHATADAEVK